MSIKDKVAATIYPVFMFGLFAVMAASVWTAGAVVYSVHTDSMEPQWVSTVAPAFRLVGDILSSDAEQSYRVADVVSVTLLGLVVGIFLRRCAENPGRVEVALVVGLLLLALVQLVLSMGMPTPEEAELTLRAGSQLALDLQSLLSRNANVALSIVGAALGVQWTRKE